MSVNTNKGQNWNAKKLISLSKNLGEGYNLGLSNAKSDKKTDSWNANKFIAMSRSLSSAYGVDF